LQIPSIKEELQVYTRIILAYLHIGKIDTQAGRQKSGRRDKHMTERHTERQASRQRNADRHDKRYLQRRNAPF
jgi:hypothetical protein